MHSMTIHDKLRLHLADKPVTWTADGSAVWVEEGPRMLVCVEGAPTAASLVDLRLRAHAADARLTVAHEGAPSPVAERAAARFGIELLDVSRLPDPVVVLEAPLEPLVVLDEPTDAPAPAPEATPLLAAHAAPVALLPPHVEAPPAPPAPPQPFPLPPRGFFRALERAPVEAPAFPPVPVRFFEALERPEVPLEFPLPSFGFFRALERPARSVAEFPLPPRGFFAALEAVETYEPLPLGFLDVAFPEEAFRLPEPLVAVETPAVEVPVEAPAAAPELPVGPSDSEILVATSYAEPALAHAVVTEPALPSGWWAQGGAELLPADVRVTAEELEAMPWHVPVEEEYELVERRVPRVPLGHHPTLRTGDAKSWGLPWPHARAPADGLAIADPRIWSSQERVHAIREDLDRMGAPSFGAAPPEGNSQWLKRLSQFGSP